MKTKITNAKVITMDNNFEEVDDLDVVFEDDTIVFVGKEYTETVDKVIDGKNKILMPGLINCHTHLGMSLFRGTNDNYPLSTWLSDYIWPIEDKMTDDDLYITTLVSCLEMIKTGTTCFNDMYFGWKGVLKAIKDTKMRGLFGRCLVGTMETGKNRIDEFKEMYQEENGKSDLIGFTIAPHGLYTCDSEYINECSKLADKYNLPIHMHLAENRQELIDIKNMHHKEWIDVLKDSNFLNKKLILAHCTYLSHLEELQGKDVNIVTNPISNLNLGCGIADIKSYLEKGLNVCLGTDGQGSGNNMNLFYHMSLLDYLQKGVYEDPTILRSYDVLKMATINGAKALGLEDKIGSITVGKKADLILIDLNDIAMTPTVNIITEIAHNGWFNSIDTTIINGEILYSNNKFNLDIDINKLKEDINNIRTRLLKDE